MSKKPNALNTERQQMIHDMDRLIARLNSFPVEVRLTSEELADVRMVKKRIQSWMVKMTNRGNLAALDAKDTNQLLAEMAEMVDALP
jgi:hypothetical protein